MLPKEKSGMGYKDLYTFNLAMLAKQDTLIKTWTFCTPLPPGEKGNSEVSLTHLIRHTVNDFDQFCTKELAKKPKP